MGHKNDFAIGPLVAILAPYHNTLIPNATLSSLLNFSGTHLVKTSAFSPPYDTYPRNITAWMSPNLTIGAESFSENVIGGPAINPNSFNPAVVQWARKDCEARDFGSERVIASLTIFRPTRVFCAFSHIVGHTSHR